MMKSMRSVTRGRTSGSGYYDEASLPAQRLTKKYGMSSLITLRKIQKARLRKMRRNTTEVLALQQLQLWWLRTWQWFHTQRSSCKQAGQEAQSPEWITREGIRRLYSTQLIFRHKWSTQWKRRDNCRSPRPQSTWSPRHFFDYQNIICFDDEGYDPFPKLQAFAKTQSPDRNTFGSQTILSKVHGTTTWTRVWGNENTHLGWSKQKPSNLRS